AGPSRVLAWPAGYHMLNHLVGVGTRHHPWCTNPRIHGGFVLVGASGDASAVRWCETPPPVSFECNYAAVVDDCRCPSSSFAIRWPQVSQAYPMTLSDLPMSATLSHRGASAVCGHGGRSVTGAGSGSANPTIPSTRLSRFQMSSSRSIGVVLC